MMYIVNSYPGRSISVDGKEYLYFGGTSYLGLQTDTEYQELYIQNLKKYGTNYGASRKSNVQISVFQEAENYLANLAGSEKCTTLSSGYLAGQLVAQTLNTTDHELFYAPETHAALNILHKKVFTNFNALNKAIRIHLEKKTTVPVVLLDAITISGNGYPSYNGLQQLPLKEIILIIDDSHGIGITGKNGSGTYKKAKALHPKELIVCCSLGKGFGIQAGAIFGTKDRIKKCTGTELFGGASPATPAALATLLDGETIFEKKRKLLNRNIELFLNSIKNPKQLNFIENYPSFHFSNTQIVSFLENNGILITNFNYPNEDSPIMSRIVLSAAHSQDDIKRLTQLLNTY